MQRALTLTRSTIGRKVVMALSGLVITGFAVGHMLGNMNAYLGEEAFNGYAATLHGMPALVWGTRLVLLAAFGAHISMAFQTWSRNQDARPNKYMKVTPEESTLASRTMAISGSCLFLYLVFHLIHFTIAPQLFTPSTASPFYNFYAGFKQPVIAAVYIAGNLALGMHLFHGFFSAFQSIGASHPRYNHLRRDASIGLATLLTVCNLSFPISVLAGVIDEPAGYPNVIETDLHSDGDH